MNSALYDSPAISESRTGHLLALSVAYIAADGDGTVIGASSGAARLLGYNEQIAPGDLLTQVCVPLVGNEAAISDIGAGRATQLIIERINIEDATGAFWYISLVVLPQPPGVLVVISDVTLQSIQQQRLQQQHYELVLLHDKITAQNRQLLALNDEFARVSQRKSDMLAMATHDLRSPLTTLRGYAGLLHAEAYGPLAEGQHKPIEAILRQTERMLDLITNFLDLRRLEEHAPSALRLLDVTKSVAQSVRSFRDQAAFAGIYLDYTGPDQPLMAMIDPGAIEQALANLLSNGIKYTKRDGRVSIRLQVLASTPPLTPPVASVGTWCLIEIADTGTGIAEADIPHIFEPFFRTATAQESKLAGSGLGLSIVQRVVQQHDGRIEVHSQPGVGSTFSMYLPCEPVL